MSRELSKTEKRLIKVCDDYKSGKLDDKFLLGFFNGAKSFIDLIFKKNLDSYVDLKNTFRKHVNYIIYKIYTDRDPKMLDDLIENNFYDIEKINNEYYWIEDIEYITNLFDTRSKTSLRKRQIESLLTNYDAKDLEFDSIFFDIMDVYNSLSYNFREEIDKKIEQELNESQYIKLDNDCPDVMSKISEYQGGDGVLYLNPEIIDEFMIDDEVIEYLIKSGFGGIYAFLSTTAKKCENRVYVLQLRQKLINQLEEKVLDEFSSDFNSDGYRFKVSKKIKQNLISWLIDNVNQKTNLYVFNSYSEFLDDYFDYEEKLDSSFYDDMSDEMVIRCIEMKLKYLYNN